jgi:hypothetical protein
MSFPTLYARSSCKCLTADSMDNVRCKLYGIGPSSFGIVRRLARQRFLPFRGQ